MSHKYGTLNFVFLAFLNWNITKENYFVELRRGDLLSDNSVKICQKDNKSFVCSCCTARAYGQFMVTMLSLFSPIILTKKRGFLFLAYNKLGLLDLRRDEFGESHVFQFWYLHFWEGNFYHFPLKCRKKELRIWGASKWPTPLFFPTPILEYDFLGMTQASV